jgi:ABC-type Fe3+ transport system permease subunit
MADSLGVFFLAVPLTVVGAAVLWQRSTRAAEPSARWRDRLWARLFFGLAVAEAVMGLSIALGMPFH